MQHGGTAYQYLSKGLNGSGPLEPGSALIRKTNGVMSPECKMVRAWLGKPEKHKGRNSDKETTSSTIRALESIQ
ncbi:MAG: hypothetical protein AseanaTS_27670 [Candidatus Pelagadaptatus aseana]